MSDTQKNRKKKTAGGDYIVQGSICLNARQSHHTPVVQGQLIETGKIPLSGRPRHGAGVIGDG